MYKIYKITNSVNNCFYYGRTKYTIKQRFKEHLRNAKNGCNLLLHEQMRIIGLGKWKIELICICHNAKILKRVESALIKKFNPNLDPEVGYNMTYLEGGVVEHKPSSLLKMSISTKKYFKTEDGIKHIKNISLAQTNRVKSSEEKEKILLGKNKYYKTSDGIETKKKISNDKIILYESKRGIELKEQLSIRSKGNNYGSANKGKNTSKQTPECIKNRSDKNRGQKRNKSFIIGQTGKNNMMFGKIRINNGIINAVINKGDEIPGGFKFGMKPFKVKK